MNLRRLGDSGLEVSEIGLGCNNFGVRLDQDATTSVVAAAIEAGINFIDTADVYGERRSESFLGVALAGRRHEVIIATKFGLPTGPSPYQRGASRRYIVEAAEASLRRLNTDYIDLYQLHRPDPKTPIEETLSALDDLVRAGKVRYIGASNFSAWRIADADWTARTTHRTRFISAQDNYSLLRREVEDEIIPASERFGLGFLPYFPLASGLLTGKYKRDAPPPPGTRLAAGGSRAQEALTAANFDRIALLEAYAQERGHSLLQLAFAWLLARPVVSSVIAGATRPEQAQANAATAAWRLTAEEFAQVNQLGASQT
jgi:aryl-alcohol dehydrogenase-like predicted oxidoreductase